MPCFPQDLYSQLLVRFSSSTALQSDALAVCSSASQTHLHPCAVGSCSSSALSALAPRFPLKLYFQLTSHHFSSCPITPVKLYKKLTPVVSALAVSAPIFILSSFQLQHCTLQPRGVVAAHSSAWWTSLCPLCCGFQQQQCITSSHTVISTPAPWPLKDLIGRLMSCPIFPQRLITISHQ